MLERKALCEHLEIRQFGVFKIRNKDAKKQVATTTLLRCSSCNKFLTLDAKVVPPESIIEEIRLPRAKMRTMTIQINEDLYDKLRDLLTRQGSDENDSTKIMSEIIALGLMNYRRIGI